MTTPVEPTAPLAPGSTVGIFGAGQLGRMLAMAAHDLGYRTAVFTGSGEGGVASPAGQVAGLEVPGSYDDHDAVAGFLRGVDVATIEFENIPISVGSVAAEVGVAFRPVASVLEVAQHRGRERAFLAKHGFPVATHAPIQDVDDLESALAHTGLPAILKTAAFGYDGKGQARVDAIADAPGALAAIGGGPAIAEAVVPFAYEASVVIARGLDGATAHHGLIENRHRNHILDVSVAPAPADASVSTAATELACDIALAIDLVGVLGVELFVLADGSLVVNELAPRVHNSGHLTIEACASSQFSQHIRAICGLPLGSGDVRQPTAMANLLGDLWSNGEPDWAAALAVTDVSLHLYGKTDARPGRKMGHLTAMGETVETAVDMVQRARASLANSAGTPS